MAVDHVNPPAGDELLGRQRPEPLHIGIAQLLAGVPHPGFRHRVEPSSAVEGDRPVVVAPHRHRTQLTYPVDTGRSPRVVANHVARTEQAVDWRHGFTHHLESGQITVNV